jgi:hypothetical protein
LTFYNIPYIIMVEIWSIYKFREEIKVKDIKGQLSATFNKAGQVFDDVFNKVHGPVVGGLTGLFVGGVALCVATPLIAVSAPILTGAIVIGAVAGHKIFPPLP